MLKLHSNWIQEDGKEPGTRFDLTKIDLAGRFLEDFDFSKYLRLSGGIFKQSKLIRANFEKVDLSTEELKETDFSQVDLAFSNIKDAKFIRVKAWYSNFYNVDGDNSIFCGSDLGSSVFDKSKLNNADFSCDSKEKYRTKLVETKFREATLIGARFQKSDLYKSNFENADLTNANFENAFLGEAYFKGANIAGAIFTSIESNGMT
ncbi:pentapeptide repeat-containing protein [Acaryochloris marina]|uniref:pentapeptide repeat-containing protein n=1 Tax=Acaryochloris marina TaxID=155978 RepID=UPI0021C381AC|nr:pentapeptide repeat-containing protein [Acaryochloris marina]BDM83804.1 hypothetical protein AM10699_66650 [Acaryochloris marina MBIC10699]